MNSRNLTGFAIIALGVPIALWLGVSVAQEQVTTVLWVAAALFFCVCLALGRHVWLLIPATLGMRGTVNALPGSPDVWALMTIAVGFFTFARIAVRRQDFKLHWSGMETALLLVALTILQAGIRNPVGLSILGGEVGGGKPYFVFALGLAAYVLVATANADIRSWRWAVLAFAVGAALDNLIAIAGETSPTFAKYVLRYYSNVSFAAAQDLNWSTDIEDVRLGSLGRLGALLGLVACTFWRPLGALDLGKPWRAVTAIGAVVLLFLGGGRGPMARLVTNFIYGSALRGKWMDVVIGCTAGIMFLAGLIVAMPTNQLPYSVQRVLSALPGLNLNLRSDVVADATHSSELRFDMWRLALTSDKYIDNKILGDGFQVKQRELDARLAYTFGDYRMSGGMDTLEMFMSTGSYHGFHAETIRFTGVVGLIAASGALIVFGVFGMRCIRRYRDSPHFGFVMFVSMPFLIHWWWFWVIFGSYREQMPSTIATAGLVKLLWVIHKRETARTETASVPLSGRVLARG